MDGRLHGIAEADVDLDGIPDVPKIAGYAATNAMVLFAFGDANDFQRAIIGRARGGP